MAILFPLIPIRGVWSAISIPFSFNFVISAKKERDYEFALSSTLSSHKKNFSDIVINEIDKKIATLKKPKNISIRPVLIYEGELSESVVESDYFDKTIHFGKLLTDSS